MLFISSRPQWVNHVSASNNLPGVQGWLKLLNRMSSWHGNTFRITGSFVRGSLWVCNSELLFFLASLFDKQHARILKKKGQLLVIWDAMGLMWCLCNGWSKWMKEANSEVHCEAAQCLGMSCLTYRVKEPWEQGSWGHHGAHLGPTGPRWALCWPHEISYLGIDCEAGILIWPNFKSD